MPSCLRACALLLLLAAVATGLASCGGGDSGPGGPTDTVGPTVRSVAPGHGDVDVAVDAPVVIRFSEAMAAGSASGNVTLSSGVVQALEWPAPDSLRVTHAAWAEGAAVTLQLSSGLRDAAGNALAPLAYTFYTHADTPCLLASDPADGAAAVPAASDVLLLFSEPMRVVSLGGAVTLDPAAAFSVTAVAGNWYRVDVADPLATSTPYTLTIGAGATSQDGQTLGAEAQVHFTTGLTTDSTPPRVLAVSPAEGEANVGLSNAVTVWFSEAMNPGSAAGQVSLSSGTITELAWPRANRLEIHHTAWDGGRQVTVTLGADLTDAAGNALGAPHALAFWTWSPAPVLVDHWPADGAAGVPTNASITLRFSTEMNLDSLQAAIRVVPPVLPAPEVSLPFTLTSTGGGGYSVDVTGDLWSSSWHGVRINTRATSQAGVHLAAPDSFTFTTAAGADATPPSLTATDPARNATVAADLAQATLTFSEPIDRAHLRPARWSGLWPSLLEGEPTWNAAGTQLTYWLRAPLPAGVRLFVVLDSIPDLAGNWRTAPDSLAFTVVGTPDYLPVLPGALFVYDSRVEGTGKSLLPLDWFARYVRHEDALPDGRFTRVAYQDAALTTAVERLDLQRTASGCLLRGVRAWDGLGELTQDYSPPLLWLPAPPQAQAWDGTATVSGGDPLSYGGALTGPEVLVGAPAGANQPRPVWEACWKLVLAHARSGSVTETGADTVWVAPGAGVVREHRKVVRSQEGAWSWTRRSLEELRLP